MRSYDIVNNRQFIRHVIGIHGQGILLPEINDQGFSVSPGKKKSDANEIMNLSNFMLASAQRVSAIARNTMTRRRTAPGYALTLRYVPTSRRNLSAIRAMTAPGYTFGSGITTSRCLSPINSRGFRSLLHCGRCRDRRHHPPFTCLAL